MSEADLRFDQTSRRLAELYGPVFALIVQLRGTDQYGDAETLRTRLTDLVSEAENTSRATGVPAEDIEDASFAVVAFLDEAILSSDWPERHSWMSNSLQRLRFGLTDAGEVFFDRLNLILGQPHRAEVLEVYYLCLTLGFRGRYQIHGQDELRKLIDRAQSVLSKAPGFSAATLAPRALPGDRMASSNVSRISPWMLVAGAIAIAFLVYIGMSLYISGAASNTAEELQSLTSLV